MRLTLSFPQGVFKRRCAMGVSDKLWFRFRCPRCGQQKTSAVLDKGSEWSPPHWGSLGEIEGFAITSTGGGAVEPEVSVAVCKACDVTARVDTAYGFSRPEDF